MHFIFFWTAKEALVKAHGLGLHKSLSTFDVVLKQLQTIKIDNSEWRLFAKLITNEFLAIALHPTIKSIAYYGFKNHQPILIETDNLES